MFMNQTRVPQHPAVTLIHQVEQHVRDKRAGRTAEPLEVPQDAKKLHHLVTAHARLQVDVQRLSHEVTQYPNLQDALDFRMEVMGELRRMMPRHVVPVVLPNMEPVEENVVQMPVRSVAMPPRHRRRAQGYFVGAAI